MCMYHNYTINNKLSIMLSPLSSSSSESRTVPSSFSTGCSSSRVRAGTGPHIIVTPPLADCGLYSCTIVTLKVTHYYDCKPNKMSVLV